MNMQMHKCEPVAENLGFIEGPVVRQNRSLVVTSIDRGIVYETVDSEVSVLANLGGGPNGAVEAADGSIYIAQNGGARPARPAPEVRPGVQVIRPDGGISSLNSEGMVAPNDLAFGPDGYLYVTDPTRSSARNDGRIWRCDVESGECHVVAELPWYPNGIGFTRESEAVYVADTGQGRIVRFTNGESFSDEETVVQMTDARWHPDGFAFDANLNIVVACPSADEQIDGTIQVWSLEGRLLETLSVAPRIGAPRPAGGSRYLTNLTLAVTGELSVTDASGGQLLRLTDWDTPGLGMHPFI